MNKGLYVVMGVAGAGKTVVGRALADALGVDFVEGDDAHPAENVERMARGVPLTDADRAGWLEELAARLRDARERGGGLVLTCSALKRAYRDVLRTGAPNLQLIWLDGPRELIATRLGTRRGHFMPASLLDSQFATLEEPFPDEQAWRCDITMSPDDIVESLLRRIRRSPPRRT